tara:strand:+ start:158013 stop:158756 length:744 start_codon:yes stop_codon:yes gene_type:complete
MLLLGLVWNKYANKNSAYKKFGRRLIGVSVTIMALVGFTNISTWVLWPLESRMEIFRNQTQQGPYSGIIVLGGSERMSQSTAANQATLNHGGERLIEAAALARKFPELPIIHSGGTRPDLDGFSENDVAELFFKQAAIDLSRIRFDAKSYNTHRNAVESKTLIKADETGKWFLVTSAFHMPRSVGTFKHAGINIQPYPVDYKTSLNYDGLLSFNFSDNFQRFDLAIHEYIGLLAYYITGRSNALFPS